ncbi:MAG: glutathione S-transferase N-terminal domain-containing protein, partial [Pseudomonadota bacterium]
ARWALHEAGADYEHVMMDWGTRPGSYKAINPMNKVPALVHHHGRHLGGQPSDRGPAIRHNRRNARFQGLCGSPY